MPKILIAEHIQAAPERVWDLISDIDRGPEWVTVMQEVLYVSDRPIREGSSYRERSKIGPGVSETEWKVTRFEPPVVQVHECEEPTLKATLTMRVEPENGEVRLYHETTYTMLPVFRPLGWIVEQIFGKRTMKREMERTVANVKHILETE